MFTSSIALMVGLVQMIPEKQPVEVVDRGWRHLCIPAGLMIETDWLYGWDCFFKPSPVVHGQSLHAQEGEAVEMENLPIPKDFAIRLFGTLNEDSGTVYCLFDTSIQRWFRLAPGQSDPVSQIRVFRSPRNEMVEDLVTGNIYRIDRDAYRLVPLTHGKD